MDTLRHRTPSTADILATTDSVWITRRFGADTDRETRVFENRVGSPAPLSPERGRFGRNAACRRERSSLRRNDESAEASIAWFKGAPDKRDRACPAKIRPSFDDPRLASRVGLVPVMALAQQEALREMVAGRVPDQAPVRGERPS